MTGKLAMPVVVGTRPEAIKLAPLILALRDSECFHPVVISTGQHHRMVAEVFTLAGMTQLLGSRLTGRLRPSFYDTGCPPEGCPKGDDYRSFLSGHAMASFTGAGLICVHHEMIPLFGGGAPDTLACAWGITAAALTGTMRIVADEHWASDVMLGAAVGWGFGYYLPKLLHFHTKYLVRKNLKDGKPAAFTWMPTFAGTTEGATAGIGGTF